jgi:hypothetical protein
VTVSPLAFTAPRCKFATYAEISNRPDDN